MSALRLSPPLVLFKKYTRPTFCIPRERVLYKNVHSLYTSCCTCHAHATALPMRKVSGAMGTEELEVSLWRLRVYLATNRGNITWQESGVLDKGIYCYWRIVYC
jgi:hypothetical protein